MVERLRIERTVDPYGLLIAGEIDMSTAPDLHDALVAALAGGRHVTVDMEQVTFIDSSGLQVLMRAAVEAKLAPLTVKNPSSAVLRVMDLFGMEDVPQVEVTMTEGDD